MTQIAQSGPLKVAPRSEVVHITRVSRGNPAEIRPTEDTTMYEPSFTKFKTETLLSRAENYPSVIDALKNQMCEMDQETANRPGGVAAYLATTERDFRLIKEELGRRGAAA